MATPFEQTIVLEKSDKSSIVLKGKYTLENWNSAEKKLSAFDQKIKDELIAFSSSLFGITNSAQNNLQIENLKTIGEEFYMKIRDRLLDSKLILPIKIPDETKTETKSESKTKSKKKKYY